MNTYTILILAGIAVTTALDAIADILNLKALSPHLPEEFADVYPVDEYRRSQEYTRVLTRFGFVSAAFDLLVLLLFWFAGGFPWLDELLRGLGYGSIVTGILYIGILVAGKGALDLPFSVYSTFVIEARFGFNKTTAKTFILDLLKGLLLAILLGAPVLGLLLWFFESAGAYAWLYALGAVTAFTLAVQYIAPTWIMPLFNKFTPLEEGSLRREILEYAQRVRFPLSGVFVIDGSKRSTKSNAFFTGFGKNKRIALFDTLLAQHSTEELVGVLAHEIGHYKKKHILKGMLIGFVQTGILFYLLSLFIGSGELASAFFMPAATVYTGIIFFSMLYEPVSSALGIFMNILSRRHEFEADAFAVRTRGAAQPLIDALKKLSASNLGNLTPHPFYVFLNYSHPPVSERIQRMREIPN